VEALGVGPPPLDRRKLDVAALAAVFRVTDDPNIRERARTLGQSIAQENGASAAVDVIDRHGQPSKA
jgi:UDP:flavonoid glycosyltransferase YjiC (YdhE family)